MTTENIENMTISLVMDNGQGGMACIPKKYWSIIMSILGPEVKFVEVDDLMLMTIDELAKK